MHYAEVIVDLPAYAVDRPYTYEIPVELVGVVCPGVRVFVPFGNMNRLGFVMRVFESDKESSESFTIKPLHSVIDYTPVITEEMLRLAVYLKDEVLCYFIHAFQVMLPATMKASYEKRVRLYPNVNLEDLSLLLQDLFSKRKVWDLNTLLQSVTPLEIKRWVDAQWIEVTTEMKVHESKKMIKYLVKKVSNHELEGQLQKLRVNALKQRAALQLLLENNHPLKSEDLQRSGLTFSTFRTFVDKGWVTIEEVEAYRNPYAHLENEQEQPLTLTKAQEKVVQQLKQAIHEQSEKPYLLHGVTGSGKTEVYLQTIAYALSLGKEAIVLVPEISLTPQMVKRFKRRFGSAVAVLHSGLSHGEKYDEWRKIQEKKVCVAVGARSAIFAPFEHLGMIIIDEEHEATYKQEETPRYDARLVAIERAKFHKCPVVLGSATPSLETYARALKGVYGHLELLERVNQGALPKVKIVDMTEELRAGNRSAFSRELFEQIQARIEKKEQVILLLNRRGYATFILCRECGYICQCPHCDVSMTYHKANDRIRCHYCGHEERSPHTCPSCGSVHIRYFGSGTQKLEEELQQLLPQARVIRMDVDTTRKKGAHEKMLNQFERGEADILLGTQMIAKGLDFPRVTLVGMLNADAILHLPDIRASERTFQLITQVSGRAGRHDLPGEVYIQTYSKNHYSIVYASQHAYIPFFHQEMHMRKAMKAPPYYYMGNLLFSSKDLQKVYQLAHQVTKELKQGVTQDIIVLGPVATNVAKVSDRFRFMTVIKYKNNQHLKVCLRTIQEKYKASFARSDLQMTIDLQATNFI